MPLQNTWMNDSGWVIGRPNPRALEIGSVLGQPITEITFDTLN